MPTTEIGAPSSGATPHGPQRRTDSGLARGAWLLDMDVPDVTNRATITGVIEIGRHLGVVHVTFRAPLDRLERRCLLPPVRDQYGIG